MMQRFQYGTIVDYQAGEDLKNNDVYIIDPKTQKIRKPKDCDEWLTCQLVYVNNIYVDTHPYDNIIHKDDHCRCWIGYLII